jgi:epsilon-lactone hydrolase
LASPESEVVRKGLHKLARNPNVTIWEERRQWAAHGETLPLAPGVEATEEQIGGVRCLLLGPTTVCRDGAIVYAHGGGLVSGSIATHRSFASHLAVATGRTVVLVEYRLVPDNPFTAPRDDVIAVYRRLLADGRWRSNALAMGGDSNGAGVVMAAMVALRDNGDDLPACAFSISGAFDISLSGHSVETRESVDPILSKALLLDWQKEYFRDRIDLQNPVVSPLFASLGELPPLLLLVGDHDIWLSDSTRLADQVRGANGAVFLSIYPEMWHVWPMSLEIPETAQALREISDFLADQLS